MHEGVYMRSKILFCKLWVSSLFITVGYIGYSYFLGGMQKILMACCVNGIHLTMDNSRVSPYI